MNSIENLYTVVKIVFYLLMLGIDRLLYEWSLLRETMFANMDWCQYEQPSCLIYLSQLQQFLSKNLQTKNRRKLVTLRHSRYRRCFWIRFFSTRLKLIWNTIDVKQFRICRPNCEFCNQRMLNTRRNRRWHFKCEKFWRTLALRRCNFIAEFKKCHK